MFKKLKAAFFNATAWGFCGAIWGAVTGLVVSVVLPTPAAPPLLAVVKFMAVQFGQVGFVSGVVFSGALALLYRNSDVQSLSPGRVTLLGAATAAVVPLAMAAISLVEGVAVPMAGFLSLTAFCAVFGAGSASGLLRLAQGAPELPRATDAQRITAEAGP